MATEKNRNTRLQKLSGSDYEMQDGQPDIRGWDVKNDSGKKLGEVEELIFDVQSQKVRYLVLDLEDNELDIDDREVLVPIGIAQLHEEDDDVILPGVTAEQLSSLPEYDEDRFDEDAERSTRNVFGALGAGAAASGVTGMRSTDKEGDFYEHEHFNDENLYRNRSGKTDTTIPVIKEDLEIGKREEERAGIRLRSRIVETPVEEKVRLREEHVHVEREPVDRPVSQRDLDNLQEEEIELRERAEVPVVNKEARVVEEISLNKEVTEREENIRDTVRNTEVDIDDSDRGTSNRNRRNSDEDSDYNRERR